MIQQYDTLCSHSPAAELEREAVPLDSAVSKLGLLRPPEENEWTTHNAVKKGLDKADSRTTREVGDKEGAVRAGVDIDWTDNPTDGVEPLLLHHIHRRDLREQRDRVRLHDQLPRELRRDRV